MADMTMTETIKAYGLKKMIKYLDDNPDENIPKLMDWMEKLDNKFHIVPGQVAAFRNVVNNPDGNWYKLLKSVWTDLDPKVRHALFENFIINATIIGGQRQDKVRAEHNCNVPWAILMDPTSACNLHCTGCWAAEYGNKLNLSLDTLESIIQQGTAMGTFMYIYSGGEPLVRKKDIITLCERHPDCMFLAFTNATLIDEEFAQDMLRVGNFVPAISVEGFEEATDFRRGDGTFKAVMKAMEILKRNKLLFGASVCYTSKNTDVIGSDEYIDAMISWGCKFAWFFTYMPVGTDAVPELMVNAEQRKFMYRNVREWRNTKPLFTLDFWNDGEYVKGCIAGGRYYLHINANGDIEPCAFIHYSDSNIHEKTLLETYKSPLFMQYHRHQPFSGNYLRPCPLLDNPGALSEMVCASCAHSTDLMNPEDVYNLSAKCKNAADNWKPVADELWAERTRRMMEEHKADAK